MIIYIKDDWLDKFSEILNDLLPEHQLPQILLSSKFSENPETRENKDKIVVIDNIFRLDNFGLDNRTEQGIVCIDDGKSMSKQGWLRELLEKGKMAPEKVMLIGCAGINTQNIAGKRINTYPADSFIEAYAPDICDGAMEKAITWPKAILVIDLSLLNSDGSLTARELYYFSRRLGKLKNVKQVQIFCNTVGDSDSADLKKELKKAARIVAEQI